MNIICLILGFNKYIGNTIFYNVYSQFISKHKDVKNKDIVNC